MIDIRTRLVLMGCAGFMIGCLLSLLPWWAAVALLLAAVVWAVSQLLAVNRDIRRIKAMIEDIEVEMMRDDG